MCLFLTRKLTERPIETHNSYNPTETDKRREKKMSSRKREERRNEIKFGDSANWIVTSWTNNSIVVVLSSSSVLLDSARDDVDSLHDRTVFS